jgi:hypothetical protein
MYFHESHGCKGVRTPGDLDQVKRLKAEFAAAPAQE